MRKHLKISLLALLGASTIAQANDVWGHSFFSARAQFESSRPERITLFRDRALARDCGWGGAIQAVPFGGQTTRSKRLGQFFSPTNSNVLNVNTAYDVNGVHCATDINPVNFGIRPVVGSNFGSYSSTISFRPRQTIVGAGFDWKQYLGWWNDECCERKWWFEVSFPVVRVTNDMRLTETNVVTTGVPCSAAPANMIQAFCGDSGTGFLVGTPSTATPSVCASIEQMHFGKICGKQKKTGVADLELKVGYDYVNCETHHLEGYFGAIFPTGNRPKGEFVFEAIVGNNKHFGVMTGGAMGFEIWHGCSDNSLRLEFETNARYLFSRTETRSIDLKNRAWSRYMLVYTSAANAAVPTPSFGINHFTQDVNVKPHFQHQINTALVYDHCGFELEAGYNYWTRQGETVSFKDTFSTSGLGIVCLNSALTGPEALVNTVDLLSGIANKMDGTPCITYPEALASGCLITANDFDLNSAAHPACMTHTVYGSVGYSTDCWCWPVFVGVGGSYEFSTFNTAFNQWLAWGKIGVSI